MFFDHEEAVQLHLPVLETGLTPDEIQELMLSLFEPTGEDEHEHAMSPNSGSDDGSNRGAESSSMDEERKRKRMISNRESARRSRWRKKRHLEDLSSESDRFSKENRELKNRLGLVANQCRVVQRQNEQLKSESVALWARLSDLHRIFMAMQCNAIINLNH